MLGEEDESSSCLASLLLRQQLTTTCIRGFSGSARRRVVEWLVDLVKEEGENMDMVALTITIIDMLSIQVRKHQLQVLAGAALLVASKSRARSLTLNRILFYLDTAGTQDTMLAWEKLILLHTKFDISVVVPHDILPICYLSTPTSSTPLSHMLHPVAPSYSLSPAWKRLCPPRSPPSRPPQPSSLP